MPVYLRLRELREARGLTQVELARRAGVRQGTVSRIERHATMKIEFTVLEQLADALDVDPALLIARAPPPRRAK